MYKEMKVFDSSKAINSRWMEWVFTCRGMACDEAWERDRSREVHETRLLYKGEVLHEEERLFRWIGEDDSGERATAWYLTAEEAEEGRDRLKLCNGRLQRGTLNLESITPLPQQFEVQFSLDKEGRPYTRVNTHPERDGRTVKGKIFFPDKSFVGADSGAAVVSIAKEFDTYGFLSGEMVKFGMPDMEDFLDWAWENGKNIQEVLFIDHPGRGEYLAVEKGGDIYRAQNTQGLDGNFEICCTSLNCEEVRADAKKYLVQRKHLDEMFLESAWGTEVSLDTLDAMFTRSRLFESGLAAVDWEESVKFRGELVDSAVQAGILSQYVSPSLHIEVMTFNRQNISLLGNYTYSDVGEIAKVVSKVNQEADKAGRTKAKKGLLLPF